MLHRAKALQVRVLARRRDKLTLAGEEGEESGEDERTHVVTTGQER